jgi:hypothetical protein
LFAFGSEKFLIPLSQPIFFVGLRLMPEFDYRSRLCFSSLFMQRLHLSGPFLVSALASLVLRVLLIKLENLHPASAWHSARPGFFTVPVHTRFATAGLRLFGCWLHADLGDFLARRSPATACAAPIDL